jgi:hypothetical protein
MLRDNLAGLIEPICDSAGAHASVVAQKLKNGGMLQVNRVGSRRSEAILAPNFPVEDGRQADKKENGRFCTDHGGSRLSRCLHQKAQKSSDDRPQCLENPRPEGAESTLTENAASPFPAEPRHTEICAAIRYLEPNTTNASELGQVGDKKDSCGVICICLYIALLVCFAFFWSYCS